jgi:hypothetical protein
MNPTMSKAHQHPLSIPVVQAVPGMMKPSNISGKARPADTAPRARTTVRTGLPEIRQLGRSLALWDGIQLFERRHQRIRKTATCR